MATDPEASPPAEPRSRGWLRVLATSALLLSGLLPLGAVLDGGEWWTAAVMGVAAVLVPAMIARSLGATPWAGTIIGAAAGLLVLVVVFAPGSALLGIIPTLATIEAFRSLGSAAAQSIYEQSIPVDVGEPLLFLLVVLIGAVAVLADVVVVSLRSPALLGLITAGMLVPPSIFTGSIDYTAYVVAAMAYLWVLRLDRRPSGGRAGSTRLASLAVGAGAIALTVVAASVVPAFSSRSLLQPDGDSSFGAGVSALADLGRDLQRPGNTPHFTYRTTATERQYLRMLTLDRFEGTQWSSSGEHGATEVVDGERVAVPGLTAEVAVEEVSVDVEITGLVGELVPVPFPSVEVSGLRGPWEWDTEGLTVSTRSSSVEDQDYAVTALVLRPTADQLREAAPSFPDEVASFLELPDDMPESLRATYEEVTADADTPYDAAYAIQQYLRGEFTYSVATPVDDGYDGDGYEAIAAFLEERSGYCVHFASAMAVLSRMAGIPARVSLGYLPGDRVGSDDDGVFAYRVGSDDLHAWPELYFSGVGWVPFEPTPGRGSVPDYAAEAARTPASNGDQDDRPSAAPSAAPTPTATSDADPEATNDRSGAASTVPPALVTAVLCAIALAVLAAPAVRRASLRRSRRRESSPQAAARGAWQELVDSVVDLGYPVGAGDSERDLVERLSSGPLAGAPERATLERLLVSVESARYGARWDGTELAEVRGGVAAVVTALARRAGTRRRIRALIAPASVLAVRSRAHVGRSRAG